jgi:hypothetical protein
MKAMGRRETVHGFRSSFSDWAADDTAFPQEVREQALAHSIPNKVEGDVVPSRKRRARISQPVLWRSTWRLGGRGAGWPTGAEPFLSVLSAISRVS